MLTFVDENGVVSSVKSVGGSLALAHDPDQAKRDRYLLQNVAASFLRPFNGSKMGTSPRVTNANPPKRKSIKGWSSAAARRIL